MISIIIRAKNEEKWITSCLQAVMDQEEQDFEIILVDNNSTDKTVEKAKQFSRVQVVSIDEFFPGKAINLGIKHSRGEFLVCLSAHGIPVNNQWLSRLVSNFSDSSVAGVYGRQEPMSFSSDFDKRDLLITFGLDRRIQIKDSFFHNANSMIRRNVWEKHFFDEKATNIEDQIWAGEVLREGYKIIYEPEASIYHYHGIHQARDPGRCYDVVRIMEDLHRDRLSPEQHPKIENMNIVAVIPIKGEVQVLAGRPLIEYTIESAKKSRYIKKIVVSTDNPEIAKIAQKAGAEAPFLREKDLSKEHVILDEVMQSTLIELENRKIFPDLLVMLECTFPFRPKNLLDKLIARTVSQGFDTVLPARKEFASCWSEEDGGLQRIDEGHIPRKFKKAIHIEIKGLGCVTHPAFVREGHLFGNNVGILDIEDPNCWIEVRGEQDFKLAEKMIVDWLKKN